MKKGAFHTYSLLLTKNSNKGYREDSEIRELLNNKTKRKVLVNPTL